MDTLGSFTLDNIITDLAFPPRSHAIKGSKKRKWFSSQPTSKSQMMWPTTFYKLNLDRVTNGYHTLESKLKQKTS
ncbi:hypothetical protein HanRHA438_Chr13g0591211 [Helianthus annuus]|uniref:Uncharacterized protein n=1 Tax=Helianthus annuus TaxID=4232 RepID=A0A9K3EGM5_HELAN|nr:hypothetical protein HanXRQr2_Chr13g0580411 [Helianthus annuus]KAJ0497123.1 hypothetical protein HanHA89_Chr13g0507931 [Helianthus annuus]KAJ0857523.1 hypothetical protein HanRHA438_Chr13g0591211 [Helianthus annuus]